MTDDLVAFLNARLAETERDAREAAGDEAHQRWALDESADYNEGAIVSNALWHLRDVEAKRRIIAEHEPTNPGFGAPHCGVCSEGANTIGDSYWFESPCPTLRMLALPYSEHPGYQAQWAR